MFHNDCWLHNNELGPCSYGLTWHHRRILSYGSRPNPPASKRVCLYGRRGLRSLLLYIGLLVSSSTRSPIPLSTSKAQQQGSRSDSRPQDADTKPEHQRAGGRGGRRRHPQGLLQGRRQDHRQARIRTSRPPPTRSAQCLGRPSLLFTNACRLPPGRWSAAAWLSALSDETKHSPRAALRPAVQYVMVSVNGSVPMSFAASEEPAAYGELVSIGGIGPGVNGKLSAAVAEVLEAKLSVSRSRFYIKFDDVRVRLPSYPQPHHVCPRFSLRLT
jgi:phenylpyruvate tautomerase